FYVLLHPMRGQRWTANKKKLTWSVIANVVVLSLVCWLLISTHVEFKAAYVFWLTPRNDLLLGLALLVGDLLWSILSDPVSRRSQNIMRSPLDSVLFQNYELSRFLRELIHQRRLRRSPIRVVMTAAELYTGREKYFVNKKVEELQNDRGADGEFVRTHFEY